MKVAEENLSLSDLQIWVSSALEPMVGHEAVNDDDGDFPIQFDTGAAFITAVEDEKAIHVFSPLVTDIVETDYAGFVVQRLNRAHPALKFFLVGDTIRVRAILYADPPVEAHLIRCLTEFESVMTDGAEIAQDVGGTFAWELGAKDEDDDDEELPTPIMILIQLDADGDHPLSPEDVARICDDDGAAILRYIRIVEEQMINWRNSADDALATGDTDEAEACLHEARGWEKTARDLRGALRHVALGSS